MPTKLEVQPEAIGTDVIGKRVYTSDGSVKDREAKPRDPYSAIKNYPERYGKPDGDFTPYLARDPERWQKIQGCEMDDRIQEITDKFDGSQIAYKKGQADAVTVGDLVLMWVPTHHFDEEQRLIDDTNARMQGDMQEVELDGIKGVTKHEQIFDQRKITRADIVRQSMINHQTGVVGGDTKGMTYAQALEFKGEKQREADELFARTQGTVKNRSFEEFQQLMNKPPAGLKIKGLTVAMGDSGFPRNPKSPAAVAQARAKSQKG